MPSKSLVALPSTPTPTVLSAQTAHSRQILTPPFSCTSALLSRSARHLPPAFLSRANSARRAQTAWSFALFHSLSKERKSSRLFPTACALFAKKTGVYPSSLFPSSIFNFPFSNLFRINTYASVCKQTVLTLFRMNTYAKTGGGGGWDLVPSETQGHETCATEFAARGILASLRHCF